MAIEARYWDSLEDGRVLCTLCPHACLLSEGSRGLCRSRMCKDGKMELLNYGKTIAFSMDPIEKKPLYHFHPGSQILSLGPNSCNLSCSFCQNYQISQMDQETKYLSPEQLSRFLCEHSLKQVAFTYTEPLTWFEYIMDFAALAKDIDIVLVTNGFLNPAPFREIMGVCRAMNIDLKSMNPEFYQSECRGKLEPVLGNIRSASQGGVHLEITNLLIPGLNSSTEDVQALIDFCSELSEDTILHFSAYHPAYHQDIPATPERVVMEACELAAGKLNYVYAGNVSGTNYHNTNCPVCHYPVIGRSVWQTECRWNKPGRCPNCGYYIPGVY